jgi:hypothetical protein
MQLMFARALCSFMMVNSRRAAGKDRVVFWLNVSSQSFLVAQS